MDIQGIECVSKVLLLISSSLALMGILFKGANEFFLNTIRMKYETIPGQKSVFSMVVTMAVGLIFIVDIIFLAVGIVSIINTKSNTVCLDAENILISIIFVLFIGAFAYAHIFNAINFDKVRKSYIDEFEGRRECHIKPRYGYIVSLAIHIIIIGISTLVILFNIFSKGSKLTYDDLGVFIGIDISSIVGFSISYSLIQVIKAINDKKKYTFIMANKDISCRLYLDIGEYYLLFKKGKETYIRKTEVKEIIRGF